MIHPTGNEREELERALGEFWFEHLTTRFDGRFHRCLGGEPIVFTSYDRQSDVSREGPESGHSPYRGPHREFRFSTRFRRSLLVAAIGACLSSFAAAQERAEPAPRRLPQDFLAEHSDRIETRPLLVESLRAGRSTSHGPSSVHDPTLTLRPVSERQRVDDHVVLVPGSAEAEHEIETRPDSGDAPSLDSSAAGQSLRTGSWQGMELASGRYQIVDTLREASAGVVYLAHDRNLDTNVVVEVPALPPAHDPESTARYMRAVRSLSRLVHPHLVKVTEVGLHDNAPFVIAEHRAGGSLRFRRPVGPDGRPSPSAPRSLEQWLPDVSDALDYLHTRNRLSREVSPANILFDENGRASLGGVGVAQAIAEWVGPASNETSTDRGRVAGPAAVIAPELVDGGPADGRADQYALAATVYEILSGHSPFERSTKAGVLVKEPATEPPELRRICPSISEALSSAVHRGLSRDPRHRFPDCISFSRAVVSAARATGPATGSLDRSAMDPQLDGLDPRRTPTPTGPLKLIDRGGSRASQAVLVMGCAALIAVVGAATLRLRPRRTAVDDALNTRQAAEHPIQESPRLTGAVTVADALDGRPRSLPDSSKRRATGTGTGTRVSDIRRHPSELTGRPHLDQFPALLSAGNPGRELLPLPNLDPTSDRPRARLADHLLPVASTLPPASEPTASGPGRRPLALTFRKVS